LIYDGAVVEFPKRLQQYTTNLSWKFNQKKRKNSTANATGLKFLEVST